MTTRLEATVDINLSSAQSQLNRLQADLDQISGTITIPVTVTGEQQVTELRQEIDRASGVIDVDVDSSELTRGERALESINNELREAQGELRQAQTRAEALGRELGDAGRKGTTSFGTLKAGLAGLAGLGVGAGLATLVRNFGSAIESATALGESVNAVNVVFGEGAQQLLDFGQNAAQSVGLATSEFQQLTVPIGALLQNFGLEGRAAADATLQLTQRAADLASVMNTEVSEALLAIGSGLRGEQEPIRALGVSFDEAAVNAKALELGLAGVDGQLGAAEKGQARLALILEQSAFAAGDFAATSDEAANKTRILAGEAENAQAALGEALLPAYEALLAAAPLLTDALIESAPAIANAAQGFANLAVSAANAIGPVLGFFDEVGRDVRLGGSDVFESFIADLSGFERALANADRALGLSELFNEDAIGAPGAQAATDFRQFITVLDDLDDALDSGTDPARAFGEAFAVAAAEVPVTSEALSALIQQAGIAGPVLSEALGSIIDRRDELGLTAEELRAVRDVFNDLAGAAGPRVPGGGGGELAQQFDEATDALDRFRDASVAFDQGAAEGALAERFGDLPTIVTNFEELDGALRRGGISLGEFLDSGADASGIIGTFDAVETGVLNVLATLEELPGELAATREAFLGVFDVDVNSETGKISADTSAFKDDVIADFQAITDFEIDLSEIAISGEAPDVAEFLRGEGLAAADLAEALLGNPEDLAAAQDALAGSAEALAAGTAEAYAGFLKTLTPQEVASLGVFAAENFVSPAVTSQIGESAEAIGDDLKAALATLTIPFGGVIDFSGAQLTGLVNTGAVPIGGGFGDTPGTGGGSGTGGGTGGPPGANYQININNPTTQDVGTSATQAAQTIAATGSLLAAVR